MADDAADYKARATEGIIKCVERMGCQPILFIGSGLSRRYFGAPSWEELLVRLAKDCPAIDKEYGYYKQTLKDPIAIGEEFAQLYQQWAWGKGRPRFPDELFHPDVPEQAYIKHAIANLIEACTPASLEDVSGKAMKAEIELLRRIRPHSVITTNFDRFLEIAFPDLTPIVGQSILHGTQVLFGGIFKIHGCISDPNSLVFTKRDYDEFARKKQYLSAKLLTYFSEHPLLFIGYSATDPNIRTILSDINECLPASSFTDGVISNIYVLEWRPDMGEGYIPAREKLIAIEGGRSVRVRAIETDDFPWVFAAFGANPPLNNVNPKLLRALLSRSYELVRHDIPRMVVHADFEMLNRSVHTGQDFAKLFGLTTISNPSAHSANYPYSLTEVAEKVTGDERAYWSVAQMLIDQIKRERGVDIKTSDNRYHSRVKVSKKSVAGRYSPELVDLLKAVKSGGDYKLEL
jgi:SIR2-like domain